MRRTSDGARRRRALLDERDVVAARGEVLGEEDADRAGAGDDDLHEPADRREVDRVSPSSSSKRSRAGRSTARCKTSPSCPMRSPGAELGGAAAGDRDDPRPASCLELGERSSAPGRREHALDELDRAGRVGPLRARCAPGRARAGPVRSSRSTVATVGMPRRW